jgi:hypothetical protein
MPFIDPLVRLNCPWCGYRVRFVSTSEHEQIYSCPTDGSFALRGGWQFERIPANALVTPRAHPVVAGYDSPLPCRIPSARSGVVMLDTADKVLRADAQC